MIDKHGALTWPHHPHGGKTMVVVHDPEL